MLAQKITLLSLIKEDTKHTRYNTSEKGKARDYRRYKKRILNRIALKEARINELEKEYYDS